jgi:hypothetical protein
LSADFFQPTASVKGLLPFIIGAELLGQ